MLRGCFYLDRAMRSPFCALLRARGLSKKTQLDPGAEAPALRRHLEIEHGRTSLLAHAALYIGGKLTTMRVTRDGAEIVQTADLDAGRGVNASKGGENGLSRTRPAAQRAQPREVVTSDMIDAGGTRQVNAGKRSLGRRSEIDHSTEGSDNAINVAINKPGDSGPAYVLAYRPNAPVGAVFVMREVVLNASNGIGNDMDREVSKPHQCRLVNARSKCLWARWRN